MATITEKIAKLFPQATVADGDIPAISIDDAGWHELAAALRNDPDFAMDYLVTIVGMDWTDSLGCIYYLESTANHAMCSVTVRTTDRENPMLHSVSDIWHVAGIYEREVYDFYGIVFIGNPDMRRLFLSIDWKGFPLRKDYDMNPELNPVSIESERQSDTTDTYVETPDGKLEKKTVEIFR